MKILQTLKGIFSKPGNEQFGQTGSGQSKLFDLDAYIVKHLLDMEKEAVRFIVSKLDNRYDMLYTDYLNGAAETDLRKYCYFLENGFYPTYETKNLPDL